MTCPICNMEHDGADWCGECLTRMIWELCPESNADSVAAEWGAKRAREAERAARKAGTP